jgi:Uma2 family endonuclease
MTRPVRLHRYSYFEYRSLEEVSSTKHEFLDGEIYAMAGGTPLHAALQAAVATALSNQLVGTECRVYGSDLRVRVLATGLATYPDVTVVCGPVQTDPEDRNAAVNPRLVFEVLSDGTEEYDRGEKLAQYQRIPTLEAVLLVSQRERRIELWERGETWGNVTAESEHTIRIAALGCSLTVSALYDSAGAP